MSHSRRRRRSLELRAPEALEARALLSADGLTNLLVGFQGGRPSPSAQALLSSLGAEVVSAYSSGSTLVRLPTGIDSDWMLPLLRQAEGVRYAQPDAPMFLPAAASSPLMGSLDPLYRYQWGLNNTDLKSDGGPADIDINAYEAWKITQGSASTIVAVIDTGVDVDHPDLADRLWTNPGEIPGNGIDDDRNGYVDDWRGWNTFANNNNIQDDDGHGTHVSGILGAAGDTDGGGAGVDWRARIMVVKALGRQGGSESSFIAALTYAVDNGARVVNASLGTQPGAEVSPALQEAVAYALSKNVVLVAAAGNSANDNDQSPVYPAGIRLPNVISVAAVDRAGNLAEFSNYGPRTVDIVAPGVGIWSTVPTGNYLGYPYKPDDPIQNFVGYAKLDGTSMAAPFVAGVVALLVGLNPTLSAETLVQSVLTTAKPIEGLEGKVATRGIVDAFAAIAGMPPVVANATATAATSSPTPSPLTAVTTRETLAYRRIDPVLSNSNSRVLRRRAQLGNSVQRQLPPQPKAIKRMAPTRLRQARTTVLIAIR